MADPMTEAALSVGIISLVLVLFLIANQFGGGLIARIRGVNLSASTPGTGFFNWAAFIGIIGAVAPDVVMLSGYVSDVLAGEFRYSLLSIMSIIVAMINWLLFSGFARGGAIATAAAIVSSPEEGPSSAAPEAGGPFSSLFGKKSETGAAPSAGKGSMFSGMFGKKKEGPSTPLVAQKKSTMAGLFGKKPEAAASAVSEGATAAAGAVNQIGIAAPPKGILKTSAGTGRRASINEGANRQASINAAGTGITPLPSLDLGDRAGPGFSIPKTSMNGKGRNQAGGAVYPASVISKDPTVVRGLGFLDTQKSPMGLAILMFIFMIYLMDMSFNKKRGVPDILTSFFTGLIILILNIASYGIFNSYGNNWVERGWAILKATGLGGVLGIFIFFILNNFGKQFLPLDKKEGFNNKCESPMVFDQASGDCKCPPGYTQTGSSCVSSSDNEHFSLLNRTEHFTEKADEKASALNPNSDEFVCDLYQGGKKITTINM